MNSEQPADRQDLRRRLVSVTIAGFRGFNDPVTLDFDASAVLLHGPNGSGKTSVFDAVQWLLTADLPRLGQYRLRRTDQYLANAFSGGHEARVEATFDLGGAPIRVIRRGDNRGSVLEVEDQYGRYSRASAEVRVQELLAPGALPLAEVLHTSGLLQQDELRQILQTRPDARYRQLMRLLGLESLEQFEVYARDRKARARSRLNEHEREHDEAIRKHESAVEQLETAEIQVLRVAPRPDLANAISTVLERFPGAWTLSLAGIEDGSGPAFALEVTRRRGEVTRIMESLRSFPGSVPLVEASELAESDQRRAEAERKVDQASQAVQVATQLRAGVAATSDALAALSAVALPLLPDTQELTPCPVCESRINPMETSAALRARSANGEALAAADESLALAQSQLDEARTELEQAAAEQLAITGKREERARWSSEARSILNSLGALVDGSNFGLNANLRSFQRGEDEVGDDYELVLAELDSLLVQLELLDAAAAALESASRELSQHQAATRLAIERQNAIPRQRQSVALSQRSLDELVTVVESDRKLAVAASALADGTSAANAAIFRERFQTLEPLMNDVFARLDPHPAFTHLSFNVESYRAKGTASATVLDSEREITVNPMLVFSSAQANIVALSAFLALGWAAGQGRLPFVMLDDPLQAMDDVNVLGFADLARHLRRDRQLVLATHEARFAELLERKLSGIHADEDLLVHKFVGWSRNGPEIETTRLADGDEGRQRILVA
ncbi:AAA family ATPase [Aeromicrobium sp.]|uniref:AAA family ATPase n=1 Tax=Aeromicrobium sp. TaxID=1871063 RepID=UPI002FC70B72